MRRAKLWSVLLAAVLLCACVVGVLIVGAQAEEGEPVYNYTISDRAEDTDSEIKNFQSLAAAMQYAAKQDSRLTAEPCKLVITLEKDSDITPGSKYESFSIRTIWCGTGSSLKKLPITIQGASSSIKLNWTGGNRIECTNDFTFKNLEFPWGGHTQARYFSCGSGNVRFEDCKVTNGKADAAVADIIKNLCFYCSTYESGTIYSSEPSQTAWTAAQKAAVQNDDGTYTAQLTFGKGFSFPGDGGTSNIDFNLRTNGTMKSWPGGFGSAKTKLKFLFETGCDITGQRIYGATKDVPEDEKVNEMIVEIEKDVEYHTVFIVSNNLTVYGDATVIVDGTATGNGVRACQYGDLIGNLNLYVGPNAGGKGVLQGPWSNVTAGDTDNQTSTVDGDFTVVIDGTKNYASAYNLIGAQATVTGAVDVTVKNGAKVSSLAVKNNAADVECKSIKVKVTKDEGVTEEPEIDSLYAASNSSLPTITVPGGIHTTVDCGKITKFYGTGSGPVVGNVTNTINGGTIDTYFGTASGTVTGNVTNTFNDCNVTTAAYGAGGSITGGGTIKNEIKKGTFKVFYGIGTGAVTANVENTVFGGEFEDYYGTNSGKVTGNITNYVNGSSFVNFYGTGEGNISSVSKISNYVTEVSVGNFFYAVYSSTGTSAPEVYNEVSDGTIKYFLGTRRQVKSIENLVTGGKFTGYFCAGSPLGNNVTMDSIKTTFDGTATLKNGEYDYSIKTPRIITGAQHPESTIKTIETVLKCVSIPSSFEQDEGTEQTVLKLIQDSADDHVALSEGTYEFDEFTSSGGTVHFNKVGVTAKAASGNVILCNEGDWYAGKTYFSFEGTDIATTLTGAEGAKGTGKTLTGDGKTTVVGMASPAGVKLNVSERVVMKICFDKAYIDNCEEFTFTATLNGKPITETIAKSDLTDDGDYYVAETYQIGLGQFADDIVIAGDFVTETKTTILSLADTLKATGATAEWKAWGASLANLVQVVVKEQANSITPADTQYTAFNVTKKDGISSASASLVMNSAVGIKMELNFDKEPTDAKVLVNGVYEYPGAYENGVLTLYIKASAMETPFKIQIMDGESEVFAIENVSVAYFAKALNSDAGNALLAYVQASTVVAAAA